MRVVIIDSIAFHFRQDVADAAARGRVLGGMAQTLHQLAYEHDVGVVVINHVTTKFDKAPTPSEAAVAGGIITRQASNAIVSSEHSIVLQTAAMQCCGGWLQLSEICGLTRSQAA